MEKLKKIGWGIFVVFSVLFIVYTAYNWMCALIVPTRLPSIFGYTRAIVVSGSMEPTLSVGDMVICQSQESYNVDDIVIYYDENDNSFVLHRIVEQTRDGFITKGDFNSVCDPFTVKIENIQGKVVRSIPNMKAFRDIGIGVFLTLIAFCVIKLISDSRKGKLREGEKEANEKIV